MAANGPPLFLLGVRRSGTTLLRVILGRSPSIAIPDESYFIPQLAARHRQGIDVSEFLDDLRRIGTLAEWGVRPGEVASRLVDGTAPGAAIAAVFESYATQQGKTRWGDKTPLYMQYLPLLERLFPDALFLHLVRDGRNAAVSFLAMPEGIVTRTWAHPKSAVEFACQWRNEVEAAQSLGARLGPDRYLEVRYETLVAEPEATVQEICRFAELDYDSAMLAYAGDSSVERRPHQQRLALPPTPGVRDWRKELDPDRIEAFEDVAGELLARLGYPLAGGASAPPSARARARLTSYRARSRAWRMVGTAVQRSPLWRRRHPPLI
jgi:Sulfotransferase family